MMGAPPCWWWVVLAVGLASAMGDSCSGRPWNDTLCCRAGAPKLHGGLIMAGAEDALSVVDCNYDDLSSSSSAPLSVQIVLEWSDTPLSVEGVSMERIYLYSHCINPTNTVQASSASSLQIDNIQDLVSSTTIAEPSNSECSYFGCYGANHSFDYYTFSEVSCTLHASTVGMLSTNRHSTTIEPQSTVASRTLQPSSLSNNKPSSTFESQSTLFPPTLQASQDTMAKESYYSTEPSAVTSSPLPHQTAASAITSTPTPIWLWLTPVPLVAVLFCATVASVWISARHCVGRNTLRTFSKIPWHSDPWATSSSSKSVPFPKLDVLDSLSLHSEKTLYEETFHVFPEEQTCAVDPASGEPILPHSCSSSKLSAGQPSNATASGSSTCDSGNSTCYSGTSTCDSGTSTCDSGTNTCDSGTSTCDSGTNTCDSGNSTCDSGTNTCDSGNSMCTADSGTASYITDGSLFYDLFMPQHKENDRNGSS